MGRADMENLLNGFGEKVGISDLNFDENGYCCLFFDEIVCNMELDEEAELLFMYTSVGEVPAEGKEAFYEVLLEANYFYRQTAGATLGIDRDAGLVVLAYQISFAGLDYHQFEKTIENFVNVSESWINRIGGSFESPEGPESGDRPPMGIRV